MEKSRVYSHFYPVENLIIPRKEILRYMTCKDDDSSAKALTDTLLPVVKDSLSLKGSFVYLPIECKTYGVYIADTFLKSRSLAKNLKECKTAVVFALSCGIDIDMLIKKYSALSTAEAFCINAIATAATEAYADVLCEEISNELKKENLYTRPRFSPGYGDLKIENQSVFLSLTNATKLVGITLTQKYMMMPSKSITAIMGVSDERCVSPGSNCCICTKENCIFKGE